MSAVFETLYYISNTNIYYTDDVMCTLGPTMYLLFHLHIRLKNLISESPVRGGWVVRTRRRGPPQLHPKINSQLNENQIVGHIFIGKKVTALSVLLSIVGVYTFK